jgi:aspartokinase-like uncharacterized kinase
MSDRRPGPRQPISGLVVKLGGSLLDSPRLRDWLDALAACRGAAVVVAGGGPFADAVREAQRRRPFADSAAHRMAILGMEQFAFMLAALQPALQPAASPAEIAALRRAGQTPVWLPGRMTFGAADIPESWDVTSDSLAVWLAGALGIGRVLLVKSARLPAEAADATALAEAGIIDPLMPAFLRRTGVDCRCIADDQAATFAADASAGLRLTVES